MNFCKRCGGEMNFDDVKYNIRGSHPDIWKCADEFEKIIVSNCPEKLPSTNKFRQDLC